MRFFSRRMSRLILLVFVTFAAYAPVQAQDEITAIGSGIVEPVLQALIEASEVETSIEATVTGTSTGFAQFCAGEADITTAARPMTAEERQTCAENQIIPLEIVLGHNILAFIVNSTVAETAACLTAEELNTIFAPSSAGAITNWNQVLVTAPDLLLAPFVPEEVTPEYLILDELIEGAGIRSDATVMESSAATIASVVESVGAIGVVPLTQAQAAEDVIIIDLDAAALQGCQSPAAAAVEDDLYPAAESLHLYVNTASLQKRGLTDFLSYVTTEDAVAVVESLGFAPPTSPAIEENAQSLQAALAGELTTGPETSFVLPVNLSGQVAAGGSGSGFEFLDASVTQFNAVAPGVTVSLRLEGLTNGLRELCNGEVDFIYSPRELTDEEAANCTANNIELRTIRVGTLAIVLLANAESEYLSCLTTEEVAAVWRAQSADTVVTWDQVNENYPNEPMTLFGPETGSLETDILLLTASGESLAGRVDIHLNSDPLYRAAATANVAGALTFMNWNEYQNVLGNNQANIQLVAVDDGNGCVTPDLETIQNSAYALAQPGIILANLDQMLRTELHSLLWFLFSDDNFRSFERAGYAGVRLSDLESGRAAVLAAVEEVQSAAAESAAEPEAEATAEATEEPEEEAAAEATVEPEAE